MILLNYSGKNQQTSENFVPILIEATVDGPRPTIDVFSTANR